MPFTVPGVPGVLVRPVASPPVGNDCVNAFHLEAAIQLRKRARTGTKYRNNIATSPVQV